MTSYDTITSIYSRYVRSTSFGGSVALFVVSLFLVFPLQKVALPYIANKCIRNVGRKNTQDVLRRPLMIFVAAIVVIMGARTLMYYAGLDLQNKLNMNTRRSIIDRLLRLHRDSPHNPKVGNWITHLENVASNVQLVFCKFINTILPEMASFLTIGVFFAFMDGRVGTAYFITLALFAVFFACGISFSQRAAMKDYQQRVHINEHLQNVLFNMPYVRAAESLDFEKDILSKKNDTLQETKHRFLHTNTRFLAALDVFTLVFTAYVIFIVYKRLTNALDGDRSVPLLTTSFIVVMIFIKDYDDFKKTLTEIFNFSYTTSLFESMVLHDRKALHARQQHIERSDPFLDRHEIVATKKYAIVLRDVVLHNGSKKLPLTINAEFLPNRLHGIEGRSGVGKTMLAHMISGIAQPHAGSVWMHGRDVTNNMRDRRRLTVYMPQSAQLFNGTIYDNIVYSNRSVCTPRQVHAVVERSGLLPVLTGQKDRGRGYLNRRVTNEGSNMSGGQKQTIMFLRTLVMALKRDGHAHENKIFILDEPHASLDSRHEDQFMKSLRRMSKTHTIVLITHSKRAMQQCDTQLRL